MNLTTKSGFPPVQSGELQRGPASLGQEALWLLDQIGCAATPNVALGYRVRGALNIEALQFALQTVIHRRPELRTSFLFYEYKGLPSGTDLTHVPLRVTQQVESAVPLPFQVIDLSAVPLPDRLQAAHESAVARAEQLFDLTRAPLFRAAAFVLEPEDTLLMLAAHPIALDEASLATLAAEWSEAYDSRETEVSAANRNYFLAYAFAERQSVPPEVLEKQLAYWKQHLSGTLPPVALPTDGTRLPGHHSSIERETAVLDAALTSELDRLCSATGTSRYTVLLAALEQFLMRYTGVLETVVAAVDEGRQNQDSSYALGPFERTLPIRVELGQDEGFRSLVAATAEALRGAREHGDAPLASILKSAQPGLYGKRGAPTPISFGWKAQRPEIRLGEASLSEIPLISLYEFSLWFSDRPENGIGLEAQYDARLFDRATIARMLRHFVILLSGALTEPDRPVVTLAIRTPEDLANLLAWNDTSMDYPRESCLHETVERTARFRPESVALEFEGRRMSYRELNSRANQLAGYLREAGVVPGTLVGLCLNRGPEMFVAMLGILKAGGAYLPLDPAYPRDRLEFMLEDSGAPLLISESALLSGLPRHRARLVQIDSDWDLIARFSDQDVHSVANPEHLAYVIYTSGSTGKPKGVMIPHRAVVNFLEAMRREPGFGPSDSLIAFTTLSFDMSKLELWLPLYAGGRIVIATRDIATDGSRLSRLMTTSGITVMQASPATWRLLLDAGWDGNRNLKILCGAEALNVSLALELLPRCASLWNMYGPTETTVWSLVWRVEPGKPIRVGHAIGNTQLLVLDPFGQPVPTGVPGELHIGGAGLARGYLNRPELTAQKFIHSPLDAQRLYRTGDLVRRLPDGEIEFLGRIDHQVKVRGFRIELGEIESLLASHPKVRETAVLAREDAPGNNRLVAYLTAAAGQQPSTSELRQFLKEKLPEYMVPAVFVTLAELPRNANGKIDRASLPEPTAERPDLDSGYVAPRTASEKRLIAVWEHLLGIQPIGIHDNYFELGAESLLTARVFARISKEFGTLVAPTALLQAPTAAQLAALLDLGVNPSKGSCLHPIRVAGTRRPVFCVHGGAGTILFFYDLAKHLGNDQPVYALQSRGLYGDAPPHRSVEEMAAHYIAEIRAVQKEGPYRLLGYCFGAIVAFEMGQQLRASGEVVEFLGSVNGCSPGYWNGPGPGTFWGAFGSRGLLVRIQQGLAWRIRRSLQPVKRLQRRITNWRAAYHQARNLPLPPALRDEYFLLNNAGAEATYQAKPYPGQMVIFRSKGMYHDPDLGWRGLLQGGWAAREIAGAHRNHRQIVEEPIVVALAEAIDPFLSDTTAASAVKRAVREREAAESQ